MPSQSRTKPALDLDALIRVMLPEFFVYGGCFFVRGVASERLFRAFRAQHPHSGSWSPDRTGAEAFENHVHPLDLMAPGLHVLMSNPAFHKAEQVGQAIAHAWFSQVLRAFPGQRFRIYYARGNNPTVRIHRSYRGEAPWLKEASFPKEVSRGHILVLQTPGSAA